MLAAQRRHSTAQAGPLGQQPCMACLQVQHDPVLAVAAAVALLSLSSEDANPGYLASQAAMVLASQLLQVRAAHRVH